MKKRTSVLLIGAACAVCCAPLLAPLLGFVGVAGFGAAGAGWIGGLELAEVACVALITALASVVVVWALQWRAAVRKRRAEGASCEVGGACDPQVGAKVE